MKFHLSSEDGMTTYQVAKGADFSSEDWRNLSSVILAETEVMEDIANLLEANKIVASDKDNIPLDSVKEAAYIRIMCSENLEVVRYINSSEE